MSSWRSCSTRLRRSCNEGRCWCWRARRACARQSNFPGAAAVDEQINQAVSSGLIPGAVLVIGHDGKVVYRKAYGERSLIPQREPMTVDTIFDAASLTKVIATTSVVDEAVRAGQAAHRRSGDRATCRNSRAARATSRFAT